ncbi:hypothetical protein L227DRAFT_579166 [Lentinus tigrinus ALCF2SS1-6]|uniref:Uncharacterized protein n=1 Tax=Lentinus tigrinus ALCF2SS1-6 TaxID=1328759 RepID=A0A5C2RY53_9APHY|nr:hypothetical protein L227DRAFT_579166 [Lentinus tigrinus ALCF2SS1-6]
MFAAPIGHPAARLLPSRLTGGRRCVPRPAAGSDSRRASRIESFAVVFAFAFEFEFETAHVH